MAKGRLIHKVISVSKKLADLPNDSVRLLYTWIIPHLDSEGRMVADEYVIKGQVVPRIQTIMPEDIINYLQIMADSGLIELYEVNGERYLELCQFGEFQAIRKDREGASKLPSPPNSNQTPTKLQPNSNQTPAEVNLIEVNINSWSNKNLTERECIRENSDKCTKGRTNAQDVGQKPVQKHKQTYGEKEFLQFWELYPKKVHKARAQEVFQQIPVSVGMDVILAGLELACKSPQWKESNGRYIPHASSWLKGECWNADCESVDRCKHCGSAADLKYQIDRRTNKKVFLCRKCRDGGVRWQ